MSEKSLIEWTDATWNPVTGCTPVSAGCANCYAKRLHETRFSKNPKLTKYYGKPFDLIQCHESALLLPLRWKKPRRIFVNSMGDLFHKDVPDDFVDRVFAVMALCPQHTFQILTKRPERMLGYMTADGGFGRWGYIDALARRIYQSRTRKQFPAGKILIGPLSNVQLGVSIEDQATADERIPPLLETPAALRFVSAEPLLGETNLYLDYSTPHLDLVIVGGETGIKARPMNPSWARSLRNQCEAARVPFTFKQWGEWAPKECVKRTKGSVPCAYYCYGEWTYGEETFPGHDGYDSPHIYRIGKKEAGRTLDGRTWDGVL